MNRRQTLKAIAAVPLTVACGATQAQAALDEYVVMRALTNTQNISPNAEYIQVGYTQDYELGDELTFIGEADHWHGRITAIIEDRGMQYERV